MFRFFCGILPLKNINHKDTMTQGFLRAFATLWLIKPNLHAIDY
jgi:hypothetical protein